MNYTVRVKPAKCFLLCTNSHLIDLHLFIPSITCSLAGAGAILWSRKSKSKEARSMNQIRYHMRQPRTSSIYLLSSHMLVSFSSRIVGPWIPSSRTCPTAGRSSRNCASFHKKEKWSFWFTIYPLTEVQVMWQGMNEKLGKEMGSWWKYYFI